MSVWGADLQVAGSGPGPRWWSRHTRPHLPRLWQRQGQEVSGQSRCLHSDSASVGLLQGESPPPRLPPSATKLFCLFVLVRIYALWVCVSASGPEEILFNVRVIHDPSLQGGQDGDCSLLHQWDLCLHPSARRWRGEICTALVYFIRIIILE